MFKSIKILASALAVCLATAASVHATELKLDNASNDDIVVAIAYKYWNGNIGVQGWYRLRSNESRTFSAPDGADMYIRVEKSGQEVMWPNRNTYRFWGVHPTERFEMSRSPLNANVDVYRWGPNLQNDHNIIRGNPLPAGFQSRRFFRIGNGFHQLDVLP